MTKKQRKMLIRIMIVVVMLLIIPLIPVTGILQFILYFTAYLIIGYDILRKASRGILNRQIFDENFLMSIATLGAFVLAIATKSSDYIEGIAVMLFYQIGELFQSYAIGKSRRNITNLMDIRPDYANIELEGTLTQVAPEEVALGSTIIIQPGERVPLDGIILEGTGSLNTSALTGESLPKDVTIGDEIMSGTINLSSVLKIRTTKEFCDSTVSKILDLVENASSRKSKSEAFISRFAKFYTPIVCISAILVALFPPIISTLFSHPGHWLTWLYRALTFLVVSCPCALVISIPLSFFAGIGCAGHEGILVKGSNYLELLSQIKYLIFDKTGTLTEGVFHVTSIHSNQIDSSLLLEYAALAECASSHPISKSLQKAYGKDITRDRVTNIQELSGYGVTALVDNHVLVVGNHKIMEKYKIPYSTNSTLNTGTMVYVGIDGVYAGSIIISDILKENSAKAISSLKKIGIKKTIMLTGDTKPTAHYVASTLGIDEVYAELLPEDKVTILEKILNLKKKKEVVAFVGDGINDAPVLTRSDIGIAMGALGSDAAIEASDVVLMDDDPSQIVKAIKISKKCLAIVKQNILFALIIKFGCLLLSTFGLANMWFAIFADVGVMVIAVLNAIRALRVPH